MSMEERGNIGKMTEAVSQAAAANTEMMKLMRASMDLSPKSLSLQVTIVNPSGTLQGAWVALTTVAGVRVVGTPSPSATMAAKNLLSKLAMSNEPEAMLAMELALASPDTIKALEAGMDGI